MPGGYKRIQETSGGVLCGWYGRVKTREVDIGLTRKQSLERLLKSCKVMGELTTLPARAMKYMNAETDGYSSKKEARRAGQLRMLEKAGDIRNLKEQVKFELIPAQRCPESDKLLERPCHYVADFQYDVRKGAEWVTIVEDVKGFKTSDYIIKRKLMLYMKGIKVLET